MGEYNNGKVCDWFENGTSTCFLNGSRCDCPFSKRGCEIQCVKIFKEEPKGEGASRYKIDANLGDGTILTKADVFRRLKIKKGEIVADWFIPYRELENATDPTIMINYGKDMVRKKFDESAYQMRFIRVYHNYILEGLLGVYIIGTN